MEESWPSMQDKTGSSLSRRRFVQSSSTAAALFASGALGNTAERRQPNLIAQENRKPGARDWQLTRIRLDSRGGFRSSDIEGYLSKQSVAAGETAYHGDTQDPVEYTVRYSRRATGGRHGGGRSVAKACRNRRKNLRAAIACHWCKWKPGVTITIPDDWPSGVYLGRLTTVKDKTGFGYWQNYVVFIVRDDRPADIVSCSDNTGRPATRPTNCSVYTQKSGP